MFSKNYLDTLVKPLFQHLFYHSFLFVLLFVFFKFEWSTMVDIIRKINITIIVKSWFNSIVLSQTSWYLQISITTFYWIIHRHYYIYFLSVIYFCIIYLRYAISNRGTIFNITFLFVLFTALPAAAMFGTVIVPLTSMYASL